MKKIDVNFFPGWVRKSMAFTIDDGNVRLDRKFMDRVKPAGIRGTFNLCTPLRHLETAEEYRMFYRGYEIANHCHDHAYPFTPQFDRKAICQELFDPEHADPASIYLTAEPGVYRVHTYAWCYLAEDEQYIACVRRCQKELELVFGKEHVKGYIWPCGEQQNDNVIHAMKAEGFQSLRITGCVKDTTAFALPADRMRWSYNANDGCLNEVAALYEKQEDDGQLKFFCFGVHAHDFENHGTWGELDRFCETYGNRPENYWYAGVGEIFDYEDAVHQMIITDSEVFNPSPLDLYIKLNDRRFILGAGEKIMLA